MGGPPDRYRHPKDKPAEQIDESETFLGRTGGNIKGVEKELPEIASDEIEHDPAQIPHPHRAAAQADAEDEADQREREIVGEEFHEADGRDVMDASKQRKRTRSGRVVPDEKRR